MRRRIEILARVSGLMARKILYLVSEDWYFVSHRLPMARAAKRAGYEVHVAENGAEAVEKAQVCAPDLILMDISMPVMSGIEATRTLRTIPPPRRRIEPRTRRRARAPCPAPAPRAPSSRFDPGRSPARVRR